MITKCLTRPSNRGGFRAAILALAVAIFGFAPGLRGQLAPPPFQTNDVLISAGNSQVYVYTMTGVPRTTGGFPLVHEVTSVTTGGMAFDRLSPSNLLLGLPDASETGDNGTVGKFNSNGVSAGTFGSMYGGRPFSIAVNANGVNSRVFVGEQNDQLGNLLEFTPTGAYITRHLVQPDALGAKWVDVACNQTTVYYTSGSRAIKKFDTSTGTQELDFVDNFSTATVPSTGLPYTGPLEALRIIPNGFPAPAPASNIEPGQVIVATRNSTQGLLRFSADGSTIVQNYVRALPRAPGVFVGVSLDPSQSTVWTVDLAAIDPDTMMAMPEAVEFDVETGAEVSSFQLTIPTAGVITPEAITIKGERLCGNPLPPVSMCGRMYGGGSFPISNGTNAYHGFTLSNVNSPPNRMTVCWKSNGSNKSFKLTQLTSANLYDDPAFTPTPPRSGFDSYQGTGTGTINGVAGATATWTFTDKGTPGTNDTVNMEIKNAAGTVVMNTVGTVKQNHPCGNHRACPCP